MGDKSEYHERKEIFLSCVRQINIYVDNASDLSIELIEKISKVWFYPSRKYPAVTDKGRCNIDWLHTDNDAHIYFGLKNYERKENNNYIQISRQLQLD